MILVGIILLSTLWFWHLRGLMGIYYNNPNWEDEPEFSQRDKQFTLDVVRDQQEHFPQRNFSVRWQGWIRIDKEGTYTFGTISDDGSSLVIDGK